MKTLDMVDYVERELGVEQTYRELLKALSHADTRENFEHIITMHGIELPDEDE